MYEFICQHFFFQKYMNMVCGENTFVLFMGQFQQMGTAIVWPIVWSLTTIWGIAKAIVLTPGYDVIYSSISENNIYF